LTKVIDFGNVLLEMTIQWLEVIIRQLRVIDRHLKITNRHVKVIDRQLNMESGNLFVFFACLRG